MSHLKVDVDNRRPLPMKELIARFARANVRILWLSQTRSPSGRGWHIRMQLARRPGNAETVALQLLAGSDPRRESYNINRVRTLRYVSPFWRTRWNVLYGRMGKQ